MHAKAHAVRQLRYRLLGTLTLRYLISAVTVWIFCWGVAVLVARIGAHIDRGLLAWGALGLGVAAVIGILRAASHMPDTAVLHAVVDQHARAGGLVMASTETDVSAWEGRVTAPHAIAVRWQSGQAWGWLFAGVAFVLISFVVPDRFEYVVAANRLDVDADVQQLEQQVETLVEERIIEADEAETFKDKLLQVEKESVGDDPAKTWEALDHMSKQLSNRAEQAAEENLQRLEKLTQSEALATALAEAGQMLNPSALSEAMSALAEMAKRSALDASAFDPSADVSKFDEESLRELAKCAGTAKEDAKRMMHDLVKVKLIDAKALKACEGACACDKEALVAFLAREGGKCNASQLVAMCCPGAGGVDRGRADAPLTWKDPSHSEGTSFQSEELPAASLQALKDAQMVGVSIGAPELAGEDVTTNAGALSKAQASGGSANTATILPRHRSTVQRYFDRNK